MICRDRLYACPKSAVGFCKILGNLIAYIRINF